MIINRIFPEIYPHQVLTAQTLLTLHFMRISPPPETEGGGHIEARKLPGPTDAHTQADGAGLSNLGECSRSDCPFRSAQIEK